MSATTICPLCGKPFEVGADCARCGAKNLTRGEECPDCCKLEPGSQRKTESAA